MNLLSDLINSFDPSDPNYRPTEIYNESWLIKLVLQQVSRMSDRSHPLGFLDGSKWYSEAMLPSAFQARYRGDKLSESRTNADGVIGQFEIGAKGKADLELKSNATQFTVVEAKIGAPLSKGTSNAKYFDQAARNVACVAEVLYRANVEPKSLDRLCFVVLAPKYSIDKGTFTGLVTSESITEKVQRRVTAYETELDDWFQGAFLPTMEVIDLQCISWEELISWIYSEKSIEADQISNYYSLCLEFN
jgi:hypothetical protein